MRRPPCDAAARCDPVVSDRPEYLRALCEAHRRRPRRERAIAGTPLPPALAKARATLSNCNSNEVQ
jgi:hypothetical protein